MFSLREFYTFIIELQKEDILKDDIDLGEGETTVLQQKEDSALYEDNCTEEELYEGLDMGDDE